MAEENVKVVTSSTSPATDASAAPSSERKEGGRRPFNKNKDGKKGGPRRDRPARAPKEFEEIVVKINRVSKTVKGGRKMKFTALVVIGDKKGRYGFGTGKATEVPEAIKKAVKHANAHVYNIAKVNCDTTPHEIVGKFGATKVYLKPAAEGTGIIAGGPVRSILELAGIRNVYSKVYGSRTPINIIRATHDAIQQLRTYEQVKELRK